MRGTWIAELLLCWLAALGIELVLLIIRPGETTASLPSSFPLVWEALALLAIVATFRRLKASGEQAFLVLMVALPAAFTVMHFFPGLQRLPHPRYEGVTSGDYDRGVRRGYIYPRASQELETYLNEERALWEHVETEPFLFWQTGLAHGFNPRSLPEADPGPGILGTLELAASVGPVAVVESAIRATLTWFPGLLLISGIAFVLTRSSVWFAKSSDPESKQVHNRDSSSGA